LKVIIFKRKFVDRRKFKDGPEKLCPCCLLQRDHYNTTDTRADYVTSLLLLRVIAVLGLMPR